MQYFSEKSYPIFNAKSYPMGRATRQYLNDAAIKNAKPKSKTEKLKDGGGLFLYVEPNGSKRWRYRFQFEGKEQLLSLGVYPDVTLKEARLERDRLKDLINHGINPSEQRKALRATPDGFRPNAFEIVARAWFKEVEPTLSPKTANSTIQRLEKHVFPYVGKKDIKAVTAEELNNLLDRMIRTGVAHSAKKVRGLLGRIYRYGILTDKCKTETSYILKDKIIPHNEKHMASLTEPKDVRRLLQSFDDFTGSYPVQCALKLSVMWFVRPSELRTARWADFDLEAGEWRFTVSKTKTPHIVPLSTQAIALLNDLHALTGHCDYVFAINKNAPMSDGTVNKALRRLGWNTQTEYTGHGARAMARTILAERLRVQPEIIEHQLAHRVPDTLGTSYNRTKYLDDRKHMMQVWSDYLDELKEGGKVIKMPLRA